MRPDQKNLFRSAVLVGDGIRPETYHGTTNGKRGDKTFIMSRSALSDFVACPSKWREGYESKDTTATKWGTLIDAIVLSPNTFDERFSVYPETYPCEPTNKDPRSVKPWNNNATFCKEWKAERTDKIFVYAEKYGDDGMADEDTKTATMGNANRALARLKADERFVSLLDCSKTQVMVTAEYLDRVTGIPVPFKMLLDIVPSITSNRWKKCLADFKTALSLEERAFASAMHKRFYDWQAAIYRDGYVAATGEDRTDFLFAGQENTPPYEPGIWAPDYDWMSDAAAEVRQALEFYCSCLANDTWPSYPQKMRIDSWGAIAREAWMLRDIQRPIENRTTMQPQPVSQIPS